MLNSIDCGLSECDDYDLMPNEEALDGICALWSIEEMMVFSFHSVPNPLW